MVSNVKDRAEQDFGKLLSILEGSSDIVVVENAEEWEDDEKLPTIGEGEIFKIPGSVASFVERLDDELTRALQHIDPHTAEYVERLTDETALYTTLIRTLIYAESLKKNAALELSQEVLNRIVMRRLEHLYFKVCRREICSVSSLTRVALASRHHSREQQLEGPPRQPRLRNYSPRHLQRHHLPRHDSLHIPLPAQ